MRRNRAAGMHRLHAAYDSARVTIARYEKCMNKKHLTERNLYMAFFAAFLPLLIR